MILDELQAELRRRQDIAKSLGELAAVCEGVGIAKKIITINGSSRCVGVNDAMGGDSKATYLSEQEAGMIRAAIAEAMKNLMAQMEAELTAPCSPYFLTQPDPNLQSNPSGLGTRPRLRRE